MEMSQELKVIADSYDFMFWTKQSIPFNIWNIGENQTYPYLRTYLSSDINKDGIVNFLDLSITANQWMEGDTTDE